MAITVHLGLVKFIKQPTVDDFPLPSDGDSTRAEVLEELLVLGVEFHILNVGVVPIVIDVFGVDHVRLWYPGGLHQPCFQAVEVDALEKCVVTWVVPFAVEPTHGGHMSDNFRNFGGFIENMLSALERITFDKYFHFIHNLELKVVDF